MLTGALHREPLERLSPGNQVMLKASTEKHAEALPKMMRHDDGYGLEEGWWVLLL